MKKSAEKLSMALEKGDLPTVFEPITAQYCLFIPPEKIRKPMVFYFQGV